MHINKKSGLQVPLCDKYFLVALKCHDSNNKVMINMTKNNRGNNA